MVAEKPGPGKEVKPEPVAEREVTFSVPPIAGTRSRTGVSFTLIGSDNVRVKIGNAVATIHTDLFEQVAERLCSDERYR